MACGSHGAPRPGRPSGLGPEGEVSVPEGEVSVPERKVPVPEAGVPAPVGRSAGGGAAGQPSASPA